MMRRLLLGATIFSLGCAGATTAGPAAEPGSPVGIAGFDTRQYPGAEAMRAWHDASPYRWVGLYLPAPCYTGTSWQGTRASLQDMGWGLAVLFVGEQDWDAMRAAGADTTTVAVEGARCTSANLTPANGELHAVAAADAAAAEGFETGTVIYLDVERVDSVSDRLAAYVRSWTAALLDDGRYVPGLYAHDHNAAALVAVATEVFLQRQRVEQPRLWVAKGSGFGIDRSPAESGHPAAVWQGLFNTRESWGGHELLIDVNVARTANPSGR